MKRIFAFFTAAILLVSCTQELEDKIKTLEKEKAELEVTTTEKDASIKKFIGSLNEIQNNIEEITKRRNYINISIANENNSTKDEIIGQIQFINSLLDRNEKMIDSLITLGDSKALKNLELKSTINSLNKKLREKDTDIELLKEELIKSDFKIEALSKSLDSLAFLNAINEQMIDIQTEQLQAAYFCLGSEKELQENNVISKEGGFIGLGKTAKLDEDFNQKYFTEINIYADTEISIMQKKAELLSTHPTSSYRFEESDGTIEKLIITNPDEFWKASKFLVIKVK